jgi:hypothetical protein
LNTKLTQANTPWQLAQLLQQHADALDHIHLSAAFTRAKALADQGGAPQQLAELLPQLHQLAQRLQQQCGARELANIIWSAAYLGSRETAAELLPVFLQSSKLQQAAPQAVSNVLLAAAKLQLQLTDDQLQQLLQHFSSRQLLLRAEPQHVSNTLWAIATMQQSVARQQLQQMLGHFQKVLPQAKPQNISNTLWAVATMGQQVPPRQLQHMLDSFQQLLSQANPQDVSNALWAVASMQQQVPPRQLQQMLGRLCEVLHLAKSQAVSNTLWAVATMGQTVPPQQLQQMLGRLCEMLSQAKPQDVSNTLWACAKLHFTPLQLLSALEQQPQQLQKFLAAAKPQDLANMACVCGQLGYSSKQLPGALLQQALRLLQSRRGAGSFKAQELCNLCWSAAVLDMQQCVPLVLQLAAAVSQVWGSLVDEDLLQLYQVHLWLLDSGLPAPGQGLSGVLSQQQVEQCRTSWERVLAAATASSKTSDFQRDVFAAALSLDLWQEPPALEQVTADGALSIDIAATTAAGVRVAIEADGPWHFIQPSNTPEGGTLFRNRALAARGYAVLSIPYWEWNALRGADSKQQYLLAKLQQAARPTQAQPAGSTAAVVQPAPAVRKRRVVRRTGS